MKSFLIKLFILFGLSGCYSIKSEISKGSNGDLVAKKIMQATGQDNWDSQKIIKWTFQGKKHIWDRNRKYHYVKYKDLEVWMSLDSIDGIVKIDNEIVDGAKKDKLIQKAYKFWANDSFWLNPFFKFFDTGTKRTLINLSDGSDALAISYHKSNSKLSDTYVWVYDKNYLPTAWKLWVKIIPIKGYKMSWDNWTKINGVKYSQLHESSFFDLRLSQIQTGKNIEELFEKDPFQVLIK